MFASYQGNEIENHRITDSSTYWWVTGTHIRLVEIWIGQHEKNDCLSLLEYTKWLSSSTHITKRNSFTYVKNDVWDCQ